MTQRQVVEQQTMAAIGKLTAILVGAAMACSAGNAGAADQPSLGLPDVNVNAPPPVSPNAAPREVLPTQLNPYGGRNRVEEDMFLERPCSETRLASTAGGKCLEGYKLQNGVLLSGPCHIQLDVVISSTATYTFEADAFVFDPYLVTASGPLPRNCKVAPQSAYDEDRLKDMNRMTRRGTNWHDYVKNDSEITSEYSDGRLNCLATRKNGPPWRGGFVWTVHASLCRLDGSRVQAADVQQMLNSLKIRVYDPVGNLRPADDTNYIQFGTR
jgi:hypothetical protein